MESVFQQFDSYDFDNDKEFQDGLQKLSEISKPDMEAAKAFYFSRKVSPIDITEYTKWKAKQLQEAPHSLSFAEVVQMIASGQEIPGIRDIPDKLNQEQPSESKISAPPKPWEAQ
ncbi:hypothetical protein LPJ78_001676 [Coemansia sp. RSA 989]|nr:hypothetical protein BX667DRAFT_473873 [Coemansia mojavensis]KAJ1741174.1 hypothetical protein LPJ68_003105 [Coemansia sp. RSA 1086]KAJ1866617.1 hypothetical protein LPJ78_001676 [Coemansia sp. RSA 989]KAJ1871006.1 hypothetical protein LPJ55_004208 [Coemansia sp. RSA 990]KAJ2648472.1 hypothetical protein IWW40_003888 [Coemansia sp. RSA 1250]